MSTDLNDIYNILQQINTTLIALVKKLEDIDNNIPFIPSDSLEEIPAELSLIYQTLDEMKKRM